MPPIFPFITALALLASLTGAVKADLTFSSITLTNSRFSVDVSGTMPAAQPGTVLSSMFFVNPDPAGTPGYVTPTGSVFSASNGFTGTPALSGISTGPASFGDYTVMNFTSNLAPGQSLTGTISGTWSSAVFDPFQISALNIYWGSSDGATLTTGTLVGANIPVNPSTAVVAPQISITPSVTIKWPSTPGLYYQPQYSTNLKDWMPFGGPIPGSGQEMSRSFEVTGERQYFRLTVE